jgi:hypothetical protein
MQSLSLGSQPFDGMQSLSLGSQLPEEPSSDDPSSEELPPEESDDPPLEESSPDEPGSGAPKRWDSPVAPGASAAPDDAPTPIMPTVSKLTLATIKAIFRNRFTGGSPLCPRREVG